MSKTDKTIKIEQTGSPIRRHHSQRETLIGLGLNRIGRVVDLPDTPATRGMIRVPLREGRTLHHDVAGHHGAGKVILRAATPGTGIIAGGPMRAVFETLGMQDVVAKSMGSSNPYNMVRATFDALKRQDSPRAVAARRNIKVSALQARRRDIDGEAPATE